MAYLDGADDLDSEMSGEYSIADEEWEVIDEQYADEVASMFEDELSHSKMEEVFTDEEGNIEDEYIQKDRLNDAFNEGEDDLDINNYLDHREIAEEIKEQRDENIELLDDVEDVTEFYDREYGQEQSEDDEQMEEGEGESGLEPDYGEALEVLQTARGADIDASGNLIGNREDFELGLAAWRVGSAYEEERPDSEYDAKKMISAVYSDGSEDETITDREVTFLAEKLSDESLEDASPVLPENPFDDDWDNNGLDNLFEIEFRDIGLSEDESLASRVFEDYEVDYKQGGSGESAEINLREINSEESLYPPEGEEAFREVTVDENDLRKYFDDIFPSIKEEFEDPERQDDWTTAGVYNAADIDDDERTIKFSLKDALEGLVDFGLNHLPSQDFEGNTGERLSRIDQLSQIALRDNHSTNGVRGSESRYLFKLANSNRIDHIWEEDTLQLYESMVDLDVETDNSHSLATNLVTSDIIEDSDEFEGKLGQDGLGWLFERLEDSEGDVPEYNGEKITPENIEDRFEESQSQPSTSSSDTGDEGGNGGNGSGGSPPGTGGPGGR